MLSVNVNRASRLFQQAAENVNQHWPEKAGDETFSYWCKFYGENPNDSQSSVKLIEPKVYNALESKANISKLLRQHGIDDIFPATFTSVTEAVQYANNASGEQARSPVSSPSIWFVKPFHLSGGRDIQVVSTQDLPMFKLPKFNIIQAGVENIRLINGRKFTARIYLLLWNNQVHLFDDGFALIHAPQYQQGSTDYSVQVDHKGYEKADSAVEMKLASELDDFAEMMAKARTAAERIMPIFAGAIAATSSKRYILLGIDLLCLNNGDVTFIEINAIPNFIHSKKVNQTLNVPFFEHTMRIIYGLGSDRLSQIDVASH